MSIHEDFLRFIAWAGKEGFDVAHSVGDGKYICLSPQTADLWKAWTESKYTPSAQPQRKWDEFGRTNSGDETGGTVQRFGFDISGSKPDIIPATNGAFVHYSDYLTLYRTLNATKGTT